MKYQTQIHSDMTLKLVPGFGGKLNVFINEVKLEKTNGNYYVQVNNEPKLLTVKRHALSGTPIVNFDGRDIEIAKKLKGYEWFFSVIPLLLIFVGGAIGGIIGALGLALNINIFRSKLPTAAKIPLSLATSAAAGVLYLLVGGTLYALFFSNSQ